MPEGAAPGTVPTDIEQATGLERLEILGKMEGIDVFDMKPLPSDRMGTLKEPVIIRSFGEEQYAGCTGIPADTHHVKWLTVCSACKVAFSTGGGTSLWKCSGGVMCFFGTFADCAARLDLP